VLSVLAALIFALPGLNWNWPSDHVELFSGQAAVSRAEIEEGRTAMAYDVEYDPEMMNILGTKGYIHACFQILNLKRGGHLTLAPVCSSWVYLSRGSTGRSRSRPEGSPYSPSAVAGNTMLYRCVILILFASSRGIWWCLEQPRGSLMQFHPAMQILMKKQKVVRKFLNMCDFNGASQKPTWLYSSPSALFETLSISL
ncbi:unnamed protein product, partial [Effrenium voratum]